MKLGSLCSRKPGEKSQTRSAKAARKCLELDVRTIDHNSAVADKCIAPSLHVVCTALGLGIGGPVLALTVAVMLFGSRAGENAEHAVISFVTGVLEDRSRMARHGNLHSPGTRVHGRIRNSRAVDDRIRVDSREALGNSEVLVGHPSEVSHTKSALVVEFEVPGFDNQCLTFPTATRIAGPLSHV